MLTLKKLQEEINKLKTEKEKNERTKEIELILEQIKEHYSKNPKNKIFIQAIDLTENIIIVNVSSKL